MKQYESPRVLTVDYDLLDKITVSGVNGQGDNEGSTDGSWEEFLKDIGEH